MCFVSDIADLGPYWFYGVSTGLVKMQNEKCLEIEAWREIRKSDSCCMLHCSVHVNICRVGESMVCLVAWEIFILRNSKIHN